MRHRRKVKEAHYKIAKRYCGKRQEPFNLFHSAPLGKTVREHEPTAVKKYGSHCVIHYKPEGRDDDIAAFKLIHCLVKSFVHGDEGCLKKLTGNPEYENKSSQDYFINCGIFCAA